jgi:hypothetical protein
VRTFFIRLYLPRGTLDYHGPLFLGTRGLIPKNKNKISSIIKEKCGILARIRKLQETKRKTIVILMDCFVKK